MRRKIPLIFQRPNVPPLATLNLPEMFPESSETPLESREIPARTEVLNTVELLENIFQRCSQADLLLNIQRVCPTWQIVAVAMPQTFLDRVLPLDPNKSSLRHSNPLLKRHFNALYTANKAGGAILIDLVRLCIQEKPYTKYFWQQPSAREYRLPVMGIALDDSSSARHRAYARSNAS